MLAPPNKPLGRAFALCFNIRAEGIRCSLERPLLDLVTVRNLGLQTEAEALCTKLRARGPLTSPSAAYLTLPFLPSLRQADSDRLFDDDAVLHHRCLSSASKSFFAFLTAEKTRLVNKRRGNNCFTLRRTVRARQSHTHRLVSDQSNRTQQSGGRMIVQLSHCAYKWAIFPLNITTQKM